MTCREAGRGVSRGPCVSLVTPTEGRFGEICALVASVRASLDGCRPTAGGGAAADAPIEMILVDSSPAPLDPARIPGWDPSFMRVLRGPVNVRKKRNQGARAARGGWIAFVDSDCEVAPDYVRALLELAARDVGGAYAGRIEFRGEENLVWKVIAETRLTRVETQSHGEGEVQWCATANLIVRKALFDRLGGFDETLPFRLGGDDVDFGLRLAGAGAPLRVCPSVVVVHPKVHWSRLGAILPRAWRWGRIEYHLAQRHPDRVRTMPPYLAANALGIALAALAGGVATGEWRLAFALPLWLVASTMLQTMLTGGLGRFGVRCLGRCVQLCYHLGTVREHVAAGSARFLWEGLILEERLDVLFPQEPLEAAANLLAALVVAAAGAAILAA